MSDNQALVDPPIVSILDPLARACTQRENGGFMLYGMVIVGCIWLVRGMTKLRAIDRLPPISAANDQKHDEADDESQGG